MELLYNCRVTGLGTQQGSHRTCGEPDGLPNHGPPGAAFLSGMHTFLEF